MPKAPDLQLGQIQKYGVVKHVFLRSQPYIICFRTISPHEYKPFINCLPHAL